MPLTYARLPIAVLCCGLLWGGWAPPAGASWASLAHSVLRLLHVADAVHHDLQVRYVPEAALVEVDDTLTLRARRRTATVYFFLGTQVTLEAIEWVAAGEPAVAGGNAVRGFGRFLNVPAGGPAVYRLTLAEAVDAGREFRLRFRLRIGHDAGWFFSPFVAPGFLYLGIHQFWYPQMIAENFFHARTEAVVPAGFVAVAEGRLVADSLEGDGRRLVWETPVPVPGLGVAAGRYVLAAERSADLSLTAYALPAQVARAYAHGPGTPGTTLPGRRAAVWAGYAEDAYRFLRQHLGDLPAGTVYLVELPVSYPQVYTTFHTFAFGGQLALWGWNTPAAELAVVAHETAHRWLGQRAGVRALGSAWFTEGLAEYLSLLTVEGVLGREAMVQVIRDVELAAYLGERRMSGARLRPLGQIEVFDADGRLAVAKGALVWRMFHRLAGDEVLFGGLRSYLEQFAGDHGDAAAFVRIVERLSGRRWGPFFDPWLRTTDTLDYALADVQQRAGPDGDYELSLRVEQRGPIAWPGLLDIEVVPAAGEPIRLSAPADGNRQVRLRLPTSARRVVLDPDYWLLDVDRDNNTWGGE